MVNSTYPVICDAPPPSDALEERGRRKFANGHVDSKGLARALHSAKTTIKSKKSSKPTSQKAIIVLDSSSGLENKSLTELLATDEEHDSEYQHSPVPRKRKNRATSRPAQKKVAFSEGISSGDELISTKEQGEKMGKTGTGVDIRSKGKARSDPPPSSSEAQGMSYFIFDFLFLMTSSYTAERPRPKPKRLYHSKQGVPESGLPPPTSTEDHHRQHTPPHGLPRHPTERPTRHPQVSAERPQMSAEHLTKHPQRSTEHPTEHPQVSVEHPQMSATRPQMSAVRATLLRSAKNLAKGSAKILAKILALSW
jgi:hypothetical protein